MSSLSVIKYVRDETVSKRVNELLGERAPQFVTSLVTAVNENRKLATCEPQSVLNAALTAASMDLPINQNLGFAYLIPYKNRSGEVCQFQMGYKGFIQLAQRSGFYKTINVTEVKEGEIKSQDRLSGEIEFAWESDSSAREELMTIGFVAYFKLLNGFEKMLYMTTDECGAHARKYSKNYAKYNSGLWADDFESMAKKTVLKLLISKFGPLNTQLQNALAKDQAIVDEGGVDYPDNPKNKPELDEETKEEIIKEAESIADELIEEAEAEEPKKETLQEKIARSKEERENGK